MSPSTQGSPKVPEKANLFFCPECGMRMAGVTYSVDESRVSCSKTKHKAVAVSHPFVSVSALLSDELATVLRNRIAEDDFDLDGLPSTATCRAAFQAVIEHVGGGQGE
jgi:hypothetical protein